MSGLPSSAEVEILSRDWLVRPSESGEESHALQTLARGSPPRSTPNAQTGQLPSLEIEPQPGLHVDRAPGRDRDYRDPGEPVIARAFAGEIVGSRGPVRAKPEADWPGSQPLRQ